ncbi:849_t:CDS:2, partial [Cetraspora pellucida]
MSNTTDEKQETSNNKPDYLLVYIQVNKYKKNAFLRFNDNDQENFLNLLNEYSKNLIDVYKDEFPLEGSEEYNSNKSYFDKKQRFVKIETENQVLKEELKQQKELLEQINNMKIQKKDTSYLSVEKINDFIEKNFDFNVLNKVIRGHKFELQMVQFLKDIEGDGTIRQTPDRGIDIDGTFENVQFVMQLKYHIDTKNHPVTVNEIYKLYDSYNIHHNNNSNYVEAKYCNGKIYLIIHKDLYDLLIKLNDKSIKNINGNNSITFENIDITNFSLNYSDIRISCDHVNNPKIYIYKLNNEYITCEKTSKKNEDVISNKLNQEFSFNSRFDDIQPIYDRFKLYGYFLNELEFNILNKRKMDKLNKIELDEIISNFKLPIINTIQTKITNLLLVKNQKYYKNIYNSKKRKFEHEIKLFEHTRNKILKEINSKNPHMTINVVEKIEITKRTSPFIFGI